jgi:RimJ/RimL family protein N-acetyltransferase
VDLALILKYMTEAVASPPGEIVLDQFVLRRYRQKDAPALAVAVGASLEHLRPWMPWIALEPMPLEDREKLLAQWDHDWTEGTQYSFGMFRRGRVVGGAGLMRRIAKDGLEIGYWVHPEFVGRGYATRAAKALTTLGLSLPGVTHIEIHHDKANLASGRIPSKLGFAMVREQPVKIDAPGEIGVSCIWRMDEDSWARRAPDIPGEPDLPSRLPAAASPAIGTIPGRDGRESFSGPYSR